MATPDVRVRLSAEGVKEVVDALKRVKAEADRAGGASRGIGRLTSALGELKGILPALSVGAAVAGVVALGRRALNTADALDELSQKTGAAVEKLSVLFTMPDFVGKEDAVAGTLNRLSRTLDDLAAGSPKVVDAFRRIGLSAQDLAGKDTFEAFVTIGERLGEFEDGLGKSAVAMDIFGRTGAELIPALNALAEDGFANVEKRAREAGLVMSGEAAAAAAKLKDDLALLTKQAEGLASQFLSGLAPAVISAMDDFSEATAGDGVGAMKTLGKITGAIIQTLISGFVFLGKTVGAVVASIGSAAETLSEVGARAMEFDGAGVVAALEDGRERSRAMRALYLADLKAEGAKFSEAWAAILDPNAGTGGGSFQRRTSRGPVGAPTDQGSDAIGKARAAAAIAEAENRLALIRAQNKLEEGENERAFEAGLRSLEDYYAKRRELIEREARAELEMLRAKLGAVSGAPAKDEAERVRREQEAGKIRTEIRTREIELEGELADLAADRAKDEKEAAAARLDAEIRIAEIQGDRYQAALLALDQEIAKTDELLRKQGMADAERQRLLERMRAQGEAGIDFDRANADGRAVFDELARARERYGALADAGQMAPIEAEGRLLELQRARLPVLQAIVAEMQKLAEASGDLDLKAEAEEFAAAVETLQIATTKTISLTAQLKQTVFEAGTQALANFFSTGIKNAESFGDAFREMAAGVADAIANMLSQMLALQIMTMIFKSMGIPVPSGFAQGGAVGFAGGGFVSGPGTSTSDSIPALLSDGEFVARAAVVREPGALDFLEAFNRDGMGALRRYSGAARYADGGLVEGGAGGSPGRDGSVTVGLEEGLVAKHIESPEVVRALERVVAKNPRSFGAALGNRR